MHEIPTHIDVADRALFGLTVRQLLTVAIGLAAAWMIFSALGLFGIPLAAAVAAAAGLSVVWQPAGKPLEDWAFVLLRYSASPRVAVWRPGVPMPGSAGPERSTVTIGGSR